jgi:hypothetical protein
MQRSQRSQSQRSSLEIVDMLLESFKLSTTQINLPPEHGDFLMQWGRTNIPDKILVPEEAEGGREAEPHITLLYGLTEPVPGPTLRGIIEDFPMFRVEFGAVSLFENEKYDVLKLDIDSPFMRVLHARIKASCPNEYKWPTYEPHATLAYVQSGQGSRFVGQSVFAGEMAPAPFFMAKEVLFSGKGDEPLRQTISLRREKAMEQEKNVREMPQPFDGIPFSDPQTWMRLRGVKPKRTFVG